MIGLGQIQPRWHDVAPWYDEYLGPPPRHVLDVGTGTSDTTLLLASFGYGRPSALEYLIEGTVPGGSPITGARAKEGADR